MSDIVTAVRDTGAGRLLVFFFFCERASEVNCGRCCTIEENNDLGERWNEG